MKPSEHEFFLAGAMMLAAAVIFAGSLFIHDAPAATQMPTVPPVLSSPASALPSNSVSSSTSYSPPNIPLPSDGTKIPVLGLVKSVAGDTITMVSDGGTYSIVVDTSTRIDEQTSQSIPPTYTEMPFSDVKSGAFILVTSVTPFQQSANVTAKAIELIPQGSSATQ